MKTVVVIPAYNEENTIASVANGAKSFCDEVVVVDDCSTDGSRGIIQGLGIKYALHERNMGPGAATRTGIKIAKGLDADVVVTLDSDGQHNPDEILVVIAPILEGYADVVVGSRFLSNHKYKTAMPAYRHFGVKAITWLYNLWSRKKMADALCCFRAYNRKALEMIDIEENGFGFCVEMIIKASSLDLKVVEVPINCIYHKEYSRNSTFSPLKLGSILAWKIVYWRLKCVS